MIKCEDCAAWVQNTWSSPGYGTCHLRAPTLTSRGAGWPDCQQDQGCMEGIELPRPVDPDYLKK